MGRNLVITNLNERGFKLEEGFEFLQYHLPVQYFAWLQKGDVWWELLVLKHTGLKEHNRSCSERLL